MQFGVQVHVVGSFFRDLNTWLPALDIPVLPPVPLRDAAQVLEVALDLDPVGTQLDPGGGGSNHSRRWLIPLGGRCCGSDHHPNRLVIVDGGN